MANEKKKDKKPEKKSYRKPSVTDLREELKEKKTLLNNLKPSLEVELNRLEEKKDIDSQQLSASRANSIKPFDKKKREKIEAAKVPFNAERNKAEHAYAETREVAGRVRDKHVKDARKIFEEACEEARKELQPHAEKLFEQHRREQAANELSFVKSKMMAEEDYEKTKDNATKCVESIESRIAELLELEKKTNPPPEVVKEKRAAQ